VLLSITSLGLRLATVGTSVSYRVELWFIHYSQPKSPNKYNQIWFLAGLDFRRET